MELASDPDLSDNKALLQHSFMHADIHLFIQFIDYLLCKMRPHYMPHNLHMLIHVILYYYPFDR